MFVAQKSTRPASAPVIPMARPVPPVLIVDVPKGYSIEPRSELSLVDYPAQDDDAALMAELARLRAENAKLKSVSTKGLTLRVSGKGALSIYGMGRFPVTLYREQWTRLFDAADEIRAFITANDSALHIKE